ncbi:copper resistance CopC family protein [Promicromonospora iranensis]|jgi:methionine-rich copper-binding protein CopC|uniref:copper resistance CopC family protein n=1 Tax=Promicromonospora iranensis TaxID=1105144 RepID=UPI0023A9E55F|nr:copper resistance protein CopC [Promicromonospora iranensis]
MSERIPVGLGLLTLIALSVPLLGAVPASAHSSVASARPSYNQALDRPPSSVVIAFTSEIHTDAVTTTVVVEDEDDHDWTDGVLEITTTGVAQAVDPEMPDGRYQVRWSVVSADGAPLEGSYRFTVGGVQPEPNPLNVPLTGTRSEWFRAVTHALVGALLGLTAYALWATYHRKPPTGPAPSNAPPTNNEDNP